VHVDQHETPVRGGDIVQQSGQHPVIGGVDRQRAVGKAGRQGLAPHLQTPALLRGFIDGLDRRAIKVEFEPRSMDDDMARHVQDRLPRERIFLAQPLGIAKAHRRHDFRPKLVPVVDCRRNNRPAAALHGPPPAKVALFGHGRLSVSDAVRFPWAGRLRWRPAFHLL
jgi:hypothetical protein